MSQATMIQASIRKPIARCDICGEVVEAVWNCDCFAALCDDCFARHACGREAMAQREGVAPIAAATPARPGEYILRDYQADCIAKVLAELRLPGSRTLVVMPTGTGKTVMFAALAEQWTADGRGRVLVMAHRDELILQSAEKIEAIVGVQPEIEKGENYAAEHLAGKSPVVVTSVQTMCRPNRHERFTPDEFGLLIIDEAHHATAATYRKVIDYFGANPELRILGVTATPDRTDEEALGQIFQTVAKDYEIENAIDDGWLVPIEQRFVEVESLDLSSVRTQAGDLQSADLARVMEDEENLHGVVGPTIQLAGDCPTLIFAASVEHAERIAEIVNRHRPKSAAFLCGKTDTDERRETLAAFSRGEFQFLVNMGLFTEGFDSPRVSVIANARPTKSRSLYAQIAGRGTRPLPGVVDGLEDAAARRAAIARSAKPSMLLLDFVGNSGRHKLVSTADILGGNFSDDVIETAAETAKRKSAAGEPTSMLSELREAQREKEAAAKRRRAAIKIQASYRAQSVNPFDVFDLVPCREPGWHKDRRPTDGQVAALRKFKVPEVEISRMSFCRASQVLDTLVLRAKQDKCTYKQAATLRRFGCDVDVTFKEASAMIDRIAANGWRRPD